MALLLSPPGTLSYVGGRNPQQHVLKNSKYFLYRLPRREISLQVSQRLYLLFIVYAERTKLKQEFFAPLTNCTRILYALFLLFHYVFSAYCLTHLLLLTFL